MIANTKTIALKLQLQITMPPWFRDHFLTLPDVAKPKVLSLYFLSKEPCFLDPKLKVALNPVVTVLATKKYLPHSNLLKVQFTLRTLKFKEKEEVLGKFEDSFR